MQPTSKLDQGVTLKAILDREQIPQDQKYQLWESYAKATDPDAFFQQIGSSGLSKAAKYQVYYMKYPERIGQAKNAAAYLAAIPELDAYVQSVANRRELSTSTESSQPAAALRPTPDVKAAAPPKPPGTRPTPALPPGAQQPPGLGGMPLPGVPSPIVEMKTEQPGAAPEAILGLGGPAAGVGGALRNILSGASAPQTTVSASMGSAIPPAPETGGPMLKPNYGQSSVVEWFPGVRAWWNQRGVDPNRSALSREGTQTWRTMAAAPLVQLSPEVPVSTPMQGVAAGVFDAATGLLSPENMMLIGGMKALRGPAILPSAGRTVANVAFPAMMGEAAVEGAKVSVDPTQPLPQRIRAGTSAAISAGLAAKSAAHIKQGFNPDGRRADTRPLRQFAPEPQTYTPEPPPPKGARGLGEGRTIDVEAEVVGTEPLTQWQGPVVAPSAPPPRPPRVKTKKGGPNGQVKTETQTAPETLLVSPQSPVSANAETPAFGAAPAVPPPVPPPAEPGEAALDSEINGQVPGAVGAVGGASRTTAKTATGYDVPVEYTWVRLGDLKASNDEFGDVNPEYPAGLQPRKRDRAASQNQINEIVAHFDPREVGYSFRASEGAPIYDDADKAVESGNGRVISLRRIAASHPELWQAYQDHVSQVGQALGIGPSPGPDFILGRKRTGLPEGVTRERFASDANVDHKAGMSPVEMAVQDARLLTPELLASMDVPESGDLLNAKNRPFLKDFLRRTAVGQKLGDYLTADGDINPDGVMRVKRAIFAYAYGDTAALERLAERNDDEIRNVTNGLLRGAARVSQLKAKIARGEVHPITLDAEIEEAASRVADLRDRGIRIDDWLANGELLPVDPSVRQLIIAFYQNRRSPKRIGGLIQNFADAVELLGDPRQVGFWGSEPLPSKDEILEAVIRRLADEQAADAGQPAAAEGAVQLPEQPPVGGGEVTGVAAEQAGNERTEQSQSAPWVSQVAPVEGQPPAAPSEGVAPPQPPGVEPVAFDQTAIGEQGRLVNDAEIAAAETAAQRDAAAPLSQLFNTQIGAKANDLDRSTLFTGELVQEDAPPQQASLLREPPPKLPAGLQNALEGKPAAAPEPRPEPDVQVFTPREQDEKVDKPAREFASTQIDLAPEAADQIRLLADRIAEKDLAGDGRTLDPHVTLLFGLKETPKAKAVRKALKGVGSIEFQPGKVSVFPAAENGGKFDVVKIEVTSPSLHAANKALRDAFEYENNHPEYEPHITLAYVKPGYGAKYAGMETGLEGQTFTADSITISGKDHSKTEVPLTKGAGKKVVAEKPQPKAAAVAPVENPKVEVQNAQKPEPQRKPSSTPPKPPVFRDPDLNDEQRAVMANAAAKRAAEAKAKFEAMRNRRGGQAMAKEGLPAEEVDLIADMAVPLMVERGLDSDLWWPQLQADLGDWISDHELPILKAAVKKYQALKQSVLAAPPKPPKEKTDGDKKVGTEDAAGDRRSGTVETPRESVHERDGGAGIGGEAAAPQGAAQGFTSVGKAEQGKIVPRMVTVGAPPAVDVSIVPKPKTYELKDVQAQSVAGAINAIDNLDGGYLIASGTGSGKSAIGSALARHYIDRGKAVVIIAPAEVLKFKKPTQAMPEGSYKVWFEQYDLTPNRLMPDTTPEPGKLYVGTYHDKLLGSLRFNENTVAIFDESHALKNSGSQRTMAGIRLAKQAGGTVFMTATPADKPEHIQYLERIGIFEGKTMNEALEDLGLKHVEVDYKDPKTGKRKHYFYWQPVLKPAEIRQRFHALFDRMIDSGRMRKDEIALDHLEMGVQQMEIPQEGHEVLDMIESAFFAEFGSGDGSMPPLRNAQMLGHLRRTQETFKIPKAVEMAQEELAAGRSVIFFVARVNWSPVGFNRLIGFIGPPGDQEPMYEYIKLYESDGTAKLLHQALVDAGINGDRIAHIHGKPKKSPQDILEEAKKADGVESEEESLGILNEDSGPLDADAIAAMNRFQSGEADVVIATAASGGTGINLDDTTGDRPRTIIVMTPEFDAVNNIQLMGRVYRLSTRSAPKVVYMFGDTSVDAWNAGILSEKFSTLHSVAKGEVGKISSAVYYDNAEKGPRLMKGGEVDTSSRTMSGRRSDDVIQFWDADAELLANELGLPIFISKAGKKSVGIFVEDFPLAQKAMKAAEIRLEYGDSNETTSWLKENRPDLLRRLGPDSKAIQQEAAARPAWGKRYGNEVVLFGEQARTIGNEFGLPVEQTPRGKDMVRVHVDDLEKINVGLGIEVEHSPAAPGDWRPRWQSPLKRIGNQPPKPPLANLKGTAPPKPPQLNAKYPSSFAENKGYDEQPLDELPIERMAHAADFRADGDTVYLNGEAAQIFAHAQVAVKDESNSIRHTYGMSMQPGFANQVARVVRKFADRHGADNLRDLADALASAKVVVNVPAHQGGGTIEQTVRHERAHVALFVEDESAELFDYEAAEEHDFVLKTLADKVRESKAMQAAYGTGLRRRVNDYTLYHEIIGHFAGGQLDRLGLTQEEAGVLAGRVLAWYSYEHGEDIYGRLAGILGEEQFEALDAKSKAKMAGVRQRAGSLAGTPPPRPPGSDRHSGEAVPGRRPDLPRGAAAAGAVGRGDRQNGGGVSPAVVEFKRDLRGGAQSKLVRASDGKHYVVKHPNNPQGTRVLANEWIATKLAQELGLPVQNVVAMDYDGHGWEQTLGSRTTTLEPAKVIGIEWWGDPDKDSTYDVIPDTLLEKHTNLGEQLVRALPFDKWVGNADARQAVFRFIDGKPEMRLIDQGYAMNGPYWDWADSPMSGMYFRPRVYDTVTSIESFRPELDAIKRMKPARIREIVMSTPTEWVDPDPETARMKLDRLATDLIRRRSIVEGLVRDMASLRSRPFINWNAPVRPPLASAKATSGSERVRVSGESYHWLNQAAMRSLHRPLPNATAWIFGDDEVRKMTRWLREQKSMEARTLADALGKGYITVENGEFVSPAPPPPPTKRDKMRSLVRRLDEVGLLPSHVAMMKTGDKMPEHLKPVIDFMMKQRHRLIAGEMTPRDVAKAYIMTLMSMGSDSINASLIKNASGFEIDPEFYEEGTAKVRPEEAAAAWLLSPAGKRALDHIESGKYDPEDFDELLRIRDAYGRNSLRNWAMQPSSKDVKALDSIADVTQAINEAKGDPEKIESALKTLRGISTGKTGFVGHLLGFGDLPTLDSVAVNFWLTGEGDIRYLDTLRSRLARDLKESKGLDDTWVSGYLRERIKKLMAPYFERIPADPDIMPHIAHHWIWEAAKGVRTTHAGVMRAQTMANLPPPAPPFYSALARAIEQKMPNYATPEQVRAIMSNPANGVKQDEVKWTGIGDWLAKSSGKVAKSDVLRYLSENAVTVQEIERNTLFDDLRKERKEVSEEITQRVLEILDSTPAKLPSWFMEMLNRSRMGLRDPVDALKFFAHGYTAEQKAKADEFRDLGLGDLLDQYLDLDKKVSRAAEGKNPMPHKYSRYTHPGGKRYRELLFTLPARDESTGDYVSPHWSEPNVLAHVRFDERDGGKTLFIHEIQSDWHQAGREKGYKEKPAPPRREMTESEMREFNRLLKEDDYFGFDNAAQARSAILDHDDWRDRWFTDNQRLIDLAEIYRNDIEYWRYDTTPDANRVPRAPFSKSWHEMVLRRMLRYAAENGFERLSWATGSMNTGLFAEDLRNRVTRLAWSISVPRDTVDGSPELVLEAQTNPNAPYMQVIGTFDPKTGDALEQIGVDGDYPNLAEVVGKSIAEKILNGGDSGTIEGDDLTIGGEGMKGFYDKILPEYAAKYVKKWGSSVEKVPMKIGDHTEKVWSIPITDEMRHSVVTKGQPLFNLKGTPPPKPPR